MSNPIIDSINTIVNGGIDNAPFDYTRNVGVVKNNDDGTCNIRLDNVNYTMPVYGYHKEIEAGDIVKLIVPENNMNKAFILPKLYEPPVVPKISYTTDRIEIGDILIQSGLVAMKTSTGASPRYYATANITFPEEYEFQPMMMTCFQNGYSNMVTTAHYNVSATGFTAFMVCAEKDTERNLRWIAFGKKKG